MKTYSCECGGKTWVDVIGCRAQVTPAQENGYLTEIHCEGCHRTAQARYETEAGELWEQTKQGQIKARKPDGQIVIFSGQRDWASA